MLPYLRRIVKNKAYSVYFIFKSMEQGATFRISVPKLPTKDPNHRILSHQRSRYTHYYFYVRDQVLGPIVIRVASFFPFQTAYYLNGHSFLEQELMQRKIGFAKTITRSWPSTTSNRYKPPLTGSAVTGRKCPHAGINRSGDMRAWIHRPKSSRK